VARPATFSIGVFGENGYKILFLQVLALSLNSGRAELVASIAEICTRLRTVGDELKFRGCGGQVD
jgi:hypothetical protein